MCCHRVSTHGRRVLNSCTVFLCFLQRVDTAAYYGAAIEREHLTPDRAAACVCVRERKREWKWFGSVARCGSHCRSHRASVNGHFVVIRETCTVSTGKLGLDFRHHWIWIKHCSVDSAVQRLASGSRVSKQVLMSLIAAPKRGPLKPFDLYRSQYVMPLHTFSVTDVVVKTSLLLIYAFIVFITPQLCLSLFRFVIHISQATALRQSMWLYCIICWNLLIWQQSYRNKPGS